MPLLLAAVLGACEASAVDQRIFVQEPKQNEVFWVSHDHVALFPPETTSLSDQQLLQLDLFLRQIGASFQDTYVIDPGGDDALARQRAAALSDAIRTRLPTVRTAIRRLDTEAKPGQTRLVIGRYAVTTPQCGDWSKPSGTDLFNRPASNFGCATTANLGLMVADPGDLIRGRPLSPGVAGRITRGNESYLEGETKIFTDHNNVEAGE